MPEGTICRNPEGGCLALPSPWVRRFLPLVPRGASVLDLACGEGRHTGLLLLKGFRVTAADIDTSWVEPLAGTPGLTIERHDLEGAPWPWAPGTFDAIVVTNYLHRPHFPHCFESLRPGGVFILETFTNENTRLWGRPRNLDHYLLAGELIELTPPGARIVAYEEGLTERNFGVERIVWRRPAAGMGPRDAGGAARLP